MKFRSVFYVISILLLILSAAMTLPMLIDLVDNADDWLVFLQAQLVTGFIGLMLYFTNRMRDVRLNLKEIFLLTGIGWILAAGFAALPFCFADTRLSYTHAFFEAMSGLTGTGSTAITGLDLLPRGILLWRSLLHFMGGLAFLTVAFSVLPLLQVSGMQLFKSESPDIERVMPSNKQTTLYIGGIYTGMTMLCAILLAMTGMTGFEAICHAMSTLSTGSFSTSDASIAHFNHSTGIQIVLIVFMLLASLPFVLYLRAVRGDLRPLLRDDQVRTFLGTLVVLIWIMTTYLLLSGQKTGHTSLLDATFMIVSAMTTTGFVTQDYGMWGHMVVGIAFLTAFFGGCSGSPAGGSKIFRIQILFRMLKMQMKKLVKPHGVFQIHYNGKIVEPGVQAAVAGFFFTYVIVWLFLSIALEVTGHDFATAFSGALAALSNTGTGDSNGIGTDIAFRDMPAASVWVYTCAMLLGRLEFLTLLVIFTPYFWKK